MSSEKSVDYGRNDLWANIWSSADLEANKQFLCWPDGPIYDLNLNTVQSLVESWFDLDAYCIDTNPEDDSSSSSNLSPSTSYSLSPSEAQTHDDDVLESLITGLYVPLSTEEGKNVDTIPQITDELFDSTNNSVPGHALIQQNTCPSPDGLPKQKQPNIKTSDRKARRDASRDASRKYRRRAKERQDLLREQLSVILENSRQLQESAERLEAKNRLLRQLLTSEVELDVCDVL